MKRLGKERAGIRLLFGISLTFTSHIKNIHSMEIQIVNNDSNDRMSDKNSQVGGSRSKQAIHYISPVSGKVTFKSNALQYCVTP